MNRLIILLFALSILSISCSDSANAPDEAMSEDVGKPNADEAYEKIIEIESNVISSNNVVSNKRMLDLKSACADFDKEYYNDERAETVLQKGIRASVSLKNYAEAIKLMDKVIKNYGTDKKMPGLLFQKAFIYSESNWLGEADKVYNKIIKRYPNDPLAEQSKAALELLYLTPEELNAKFSTK